MPDAKRTRRRQKNIIMCNTPITILNRSKRFRYSVDSASLTVPCGHCKECEKKKQNDWFFRASMEYMRVLKNNGYVLFPTLTYNDENLVFWNDEELGFKCPVFDKKHFVAFRNKLRVYLKREGFNVSEENTIRYMYVCEYGGKRGRPHLHCCLFVPYSIPLSIMKHCVSKAWIYGFVRYSPKGECIQSVKALRYCMKYISKPVVWIRDYQIDEYLFKLKSQCDTKDIVKRQYALSKIKMFKRFLPHHCQSMGFGSSFVPTDVQFIVGKVPASDIGLYDLQFMYQIPQYYYRKYLFDFDKLTGIYTINQKGVEVFGKRFKKMYDSYVKYLVSKLDITYYDVFSNQLPEISLIGGYEDFLYLCKHYDVDLLASYLISFRGVALPHDVMQSMVYAKSDDVYSFIKDNVYFYYMRKIDNRDVFICDNDFKPKLYKGFSNLPQLSRIEGALQFMDCADKLIGYFINKCYHDELYRQQIQVSRFKYLV